MKSLKWVWAIASTWLTVAFVFPHIAGISFTGTLGTALGISFVKLGVTVILAVLGVIGLDSNTIPALGANEGNAQALLVDLSGSVDNVLQAFNASGKNNLAFIPGINYQRTWQQREFSLFFQDDFRLKPNLTLNLGARYEYYGVPFDANGRAAAPVGQSEGSGRLECRWQREQLPDAIRELVLDDQRLRNDICWGVFDC